MGLFDNDVPIGPEGGGDTTVGPVAPVNPFTAAPSPLTHPYQNGAPMAQQWVSSASGPVAESLDKPISESNIPGIGTQAAASMATEPEQRRRIVAAQLFPDLPPLEAQSRIFYGPDGRLAAVGEGGKPFYVTPLAKEYAPDPAHPSTFLPDNLSARLGALAGPALPAGGAIIGGAAAAPTSLVIGPAGAAAGAAVGDAARQTIAQKLDPGVPDPKGGPPLAPDYNWKQTGREALGAALGQLLGAGFNRGLRPNPMGASDYDLRTLRDNPLIQQRIDERYARAGAQNVTLTPGQASGLPSMINLEDVYASGGAGPQGADIASRFYENQRPQVVSAFDRMAGNVSPATDKTDAALQFQQGAADTQRVIREQGNAAARPFYQAAERGGQVMSPDLAQLMDAPAVQTAMNAARTEYANMYRRAAPETPDFALWDLTKRKLDDAQTIARRAGENTTAASVDSLRGDLLTHLDAAYPDYGVARATTAPFQRQAARLDAAVDTTGGSGTERARAIVGPAFETNNPRAIAETRANFIQAGREDEWNAGTRAYMQDIFDSTTKSQDGLNPSMLRRQLWSDPNKRAAMQAAMDPQAFQGFENMMGTLEDVARSRGMNSLTATRQAAAADLKTAARDTPLSRALGALKYVSLEAPAKASESIQNWLAKRNVDRIGEYLFSENGQQYLRDMGRLPPGARSLTATARFLGQQEGLRESPPTQMVPPGRQTYLPRDLPGLLGMTP